MKIACIGGGGPSGVPGRKSARVISPVLQRRHAALTGAVKGIGAAVAASFTGQALSVSGGEVM